MTHLPFDASLALRAVGEASADLLYVVLRDGTIAYANETAAQLAGLTSASIIGRRWNELGLPFDLDESRELTIPAATGARTFEQLLSPMRDGGGETIGVALTARDVTERRAVDDELRAQRRFRPGLATMDLDGRLTSASDSFVEMFGWSADEVVTFGPPYPFWPPEEIEHIRSHFEVVMAAQDRAQRPLEFIFRRRNDERFPVLVQPSALFDEQGAVVGWVAIITDISNQRAAEQRYRDLADSMPQIVWSARADGVIDYYNRRWYDFTGMEPGSIGDESWTPILHPDDVERTIATWYASVRSGNPYQIEYRFRDRETGDYRWHLGRAVPVVDASGQVIRWYGTSTEIDQLKHAESEVVRHGEVLERQNFMLRTLLDVSEVLSAELDLENVLQSVTLAATMLTGAEYGALWFDGELRALTGIPRDALQTFAAASALEVPILSRAGAPIGRLTFGHSQPGKLGEDAERLVTAVAAQAAIAIDNARAAAGLRAEEERYRTLVTATSQIVWSTDADGSPRGDTTGWHELTGGTAEGNENGGWLQHIHPDDQERMIRTWQNALATSQPYSLELRIRAARGWFGTRVDRHVDRHRRAQTRRRGDVVSRRCLGAADRVA
jgi:PAS domain S-box-containing protein